MRGGGFEDCVSIRPQGWAGLQAVGISRVDMSLDIGYGLGQLGQVFSIMILASGDRSFLFLASR